MINTIQPNQYVARIYEKMAVRLPEQTAKQVLQAYNNPAVEVTISKEAKILAALPCLVSTKPERC